MGEKANKIIHITEENVIQLNAEIVDALQLSPGDNIAITCNDNNELILERERDSRPDQN